MKSEYEIWKDELSKKKHPIAYKYGSAIIVCFALSAVFFGIWVLGL